RRRRPQRADRAVRRGAPGAAGWTRLQLGGPAHDAYAARAADGSPLEPAAIERLRAGLLPGDRHVAARPRDRRRLTFAADGPGSARGARVAARDRRGPGGRRTRRARPDRALPLARPAPHLRRALARLPPPGPDRHVRDLLEPRGDAGRVGLRARARGLDLPELPGVGDRAPARAPGLDDPLLVAWTSGRLVEPR